MRNMKFWRTSVITNTIRGLCLFLSGEASAAELFTSMLNIQTANPGKPLSALMCQVVNVSSSPRSGTLQIIGGDGNSLSTVSYNTIQPGVGTGDSVTVFSTATPITTAYCKITVHALPGEKNRVAARAIRGSLVLTDQNGNAVATAEAR
jgi:hypothetical protein